MARRALAYIQAVAERGSIKNAAEQLFISASALSKYIQKVEQDMGLPLFERYGKHFVLNYAGQRYLAWAQEIDALEERMRAEMRDLSAHQQGKIRVSVQSFVSGLFVDQILPRFYEKYPDICISLSEDRVENLLDKLKRFQVDAVITARPVPASAHPYQVVPLCQSQAVLIVPEHSELLKKCVKKEGFRYPWLDLRECQEQRVITLHPDPEAHQPTEEILNSFPKRPQVVAEFRTLRTALDAVAGGIGILFGADAMLDTNSRDASKLRLVSYGEAPQYRDIFLIYHKDLYRSGPVQHLFDLCRQCF